MRERYAVMAHASHRIQEIRIGPLNQVQFTPDSHSHSVPLYDAQNNELYKNGHFYMQGFGVWQDL